MKKVFLGFAALLLTAATSNAQGGTQVGFQIGPTWAMSGDSPLEEEEFKQDFDTGLAWGVYAAGPLGGTFGWRAEFGRDNFPADADRVAGAIEGDYHVSRFMGGIQLANWAGESAGQPYAYFTLGLARESADLSITDTGIDIDLGSSNDFGVSFGGGYNYFVGESWGVGGDLRISGGFFESTRWWWTPSAQVFFSF